MQCLTGHTAPMYSILALHCRVQQCSFHCEIFGSYLQQHHRHHVFRALFYAEPHSQTEVNNEENLLGLIPGYKLTASEVTYFTLLSCRTSYLGVSGGQADSYALLQLLRGYSIIKIFIFHFVGSLVVALRL